MAFSPDGALLALGLYGHVIKLWELESGRELRTLTGHSGKVNSVAFSPDGALLASESGDDTIKLWEVESGRELRTLTGHGGRVSNCFQVANFSSLSHLTSLHLQGTISTYVLFEGRRWINCTVWAKQLS